jgi:hypothetical protein
MDSKKRTSSQANQVNPATNGQTPYAHGPHTAKKRNTSTAQFTPTQPHVQPLHPQQLHLAPPNMGQQQQVQHHPQFPFGQPNLGQQQQVQHQPQFPFGQPNLGQQQQLHQPQPFHPLFHPQLLQMFMQQQHQHQQQWQPSQQAPNPFAPMSAPPRQNHNPFQPSQQPTQVLSPMVQQQRPQTQLSPTHDHTNPFSSSPHNGQRQQTVQSTQPVNPFSAPLQTPLRQQTTQTGPVQQQSSQLAPLMSIPSRQQNQQGTQQSLAPNASTPQVQVQNGPQSQQPQQPAPVKFRIDERGKLHYAAREQNAQANHTYVTMSASDFVTYKSAGKRYSQEKLTDTTTMTSYVKRGNDFYLHQKGANPQGQLAPNQQELHQRFADKLFIDRSRDDRTGQDLKAFDVGHYKKKSSGSRMDVVSGKSENFGANRDHVNSGESLKQRAIKAGKDANHAYNEGLTIAIPNDLMHKTFSPTFGGRQTSKDTVDGVVQTRMKHDVANPGLGFYRDVSTMINRTEGQNLGPGFDMTQKSTKLTQHGAYRFMFKGNVKINSGDNSRGFSPTTPGVNLTHNVHPKKPGRIGTYSGTTDNSTTIGKQMSTFLMNKL